MSVVPSDFYKIEPRDALGRWVSSGLSSSPTDRLWRTKPFSDQSVRLRATLLANHTYLSLPPALRGFWGWDNEEAIDALSELAPIWAAASDLSDGEFYERYLKNDFGLHRVHLLRGAVSATMHAQTYGELADASRALAEVVKQLGADDWPRFLAAAHERARADQRPESDSDTQEGWVRLPPADRNDALGGLLEWIANAKPADAPFLRQEIKQTYYDVGDRTGGDALTAALENALEPGVTRQDREDILQTYDHYTYGDPADAGAMRMMFITGSLLLPEAPESDANLIAGPEAAEPEIVLERLGEPVNGGGSGNRSLVTLALTRDAAGNAIPVAEADSSFAFARSRDISVTGANLEASSVKIVRQEPGFIGTFDARAANGNGFDPATHAKIVNGRPQLVVVEDKAGLMTNRLTALGQGSRGAMQLITNSEALAEAIQFSDIPDIYKPALIDQAISRTFEIELHVSDLSNLPQSRLNFLSEMGLHLSRIVIVPSK